MRSAKSKKPGSEGSKRFGLRGRGRLQALLVFGAAATSCTQGGPAAPEPKPPGVSPGPAAGPSGSGRLSPAAPTPGPPAVVAVPRAPAPQSGAVATGRAILVGPPPPAAPQPRGSDPFCARRQLTDDSLVVDPQGGLRSVLVRVVEGAGGPYAPPAEPVTLTQSECRYRPRVLGAVRGQPVQVSNSDGTLHNVHALVGGSTVLNQLQINAEAPLIDLRQVVAAAAKSPLTLRCDVHPWMTAYLWVLEHPFFAVTAEDGTFAIKNLPGGEYTLEAWHERLGTRRAKLTIPSSAAAAKPARIEFRFTLEATAPSSEAGRPAPSPAPTGG